MFTVTEEESNEAYHHYHDLPRYTYILMLDTDVIIPPPQVNSLYSGDSGSIKVNAMNAPNNSTLQVNDAIIIQYS